MTDRYTDELFALPSNVATTVAFPVSRLVVDPERFTDDAHEPMAKKGMGVAYTQTSGGESLRQTPSALERQQLLARFYEPHHAALTTAVEAALAAHETCLVLDGHSFPSRALPFEYDQGPDRPEICIGTDKSHTPSFLRDAALRAFEELGWSVAVDRPFAGALVPMRFYQKDRRVRALMVEVRRDLYMDEQSGARLPRFDEVRKRISAAVSAIAAVGVSRRDGG
jgi:N-formylglutamate amidohydrolase